jgi:hypothetical protein
MPQRHSPVAEQVSACPGSHGTQTDPPTPQASNAAGLHCGPEQQPMGQLVAQPSQAPPTQRSAPQSWHWAPAAPQTPSAVPGWQVVPAQHPVGQLAALHTHTPPAQRWPSPHGGPPPQVQVPDGEQELAAPAAQGKQPPPPVPQASTEGETQRSLAQQPDGQLVASHTHAPPTQRCPGLHAGPAPQVHVPDGEHASAAPGGQAAQAPPALPQLPSDSGRQIPP